MRTILALIVTLSAISTVSADEALPPGKSKIVLINTLLQRAGAQKDQQTHLLGTDNSGRLCEVFVAGRTLGWAFDKSLSGTPQYFDQYLYFNPDGTYPEAESSGNKIDIIDKVGGATITLQINPNRISQLFDGNFVLKAPKLTLECKLQKLINDDTHGTGIILRTGIRQ